MCVVKLNAHTRVDGCTLSKNFDTLYRSCIVNPKPCVWLKRVVPEKYFAFFSVMAGIQRLILAPRSSPLCGLSFFCGA